MKTSSLPPLARAAAHHLPSVEALFGLHMIRAGIVRSFNRQTGHVDLRLTFSTDEDRFDRETEAKRIAHRHLIACGFVVGYAGPDHHIRITGYYGTAIPVEAAPAAAPAGPGLAKVYDLGAERTRRAS